jgi:hypothetical protein
MLAQVLGIGVGQGVDGVGEALQQQGPEVSGQSQGFSGEAAGQTAQVQDSVGTQRSQLFVNTGGGGIWSVERGGLTSASSDSPNAFLPGPGPHSPHQSPSPSHQQVSQRHSPHIPRTPSHEQLSSHIPHTPSCEQLSPYTPHTPSREQLSSYIPHTPSREQLSPSQRRDHEQRSPHLDHPHVPSHSIPTPPNDAVDYIYRSSEVSAISPGLDLKGFGTSPSAPSYEPATYISKIAENLQGSYKRI